MASLQLSHVLVRRGREQMEKALRALPAKLSTAYNEVINRITTQDAETESAGMQTLTWIFHAARPLKMDELRVALDVEKGHPNADHAPQFSPVDVIEMCHSLVVHEESSGVVRFVHPTVQGYLESCNLSKVSLAQTCLAYLEHDLLDGICSDKASMETRLQTYKFCGYAVNFWGFHVRGEVENLAEIQQTVVRLFASEGKKNFILQTASYLTSSWDRLSFVRDQNILHIVAANGLALMCRQFLGINLRDETYSSFVDETNSEEFTVRNLVAKCGIFEARGHRSMGEDAAALGSHQGPRHGHGAAVEGRGEARGHRSRREDAAALGSQQGPRHSCGGAVEGRGEVRGQRSMGEDAAALGSHQGPRQGRGGAVEGRGEARGHRPRREDAAAFGSQQGPRHGRGGAIEGRGEVRGHRSMGEEAAALGSHQGPRQGRGDAVEGRGEARGHRLLRDDAATLGSQQGLRHGRGGAAQGMRK